MNELDVLFEVVNKLERLKIDYMLTGSLALNIYTQPRMTRNIDIIINMLPNDISRIVEAFKTGYYISEIAVKEAVFYKSSFTVIHNVSIVKVDFLIMKNEDYRINEFNRKQEIDVQGNVVKIVSKENLIISKLIWSYDSKSAKQKEDILNLLESGFEKEYLKKWLNELNLTTFFKEFIDARYLT